MHTILLNVNFRKLAKQVCAFPNSDPLQGKNQNSADAPGILNAMEEMDIPAFKVFLLKTPILC